MPSPYWPRLKRLVSTLSPQEKTYFKNITNASVSHLNKESKLVGLFDALDDSSADEGQQHQYAENRKLQELLEDRVLDSLAMDVSLGREPADTAHTQLLKIQKKFLKVRILHNRMVMKRAFKLAGNCAEQAGALEEYDLALQCLRLQLSMVSLHNEEHSFQKLLQKIDHYEYCDKVQSEAIRLYRELKLKKYLRITENLDIFVRTTIERLCKMEMKARTRSVVFVKLYFEKEHKELSGKPDLALEILSQLHTVYKELSCTQLLLNVYELVLEQGKMNFEMGNTRVARGQLLSTVANLPVESDSSQDARELLFLIDYIEGDLENCNRELQTFTTSLYFKENLPSPLKLRWQFYQCCLLLRTKNLEMCNKRIDDLYVVGKPPQEMNLHLRFMKTICYVEREKLDLADKEIEALRKYISRNNLAKTMADHHLEGLHEILSQLRYSGYRFSLLSKRGVNINDSVRSRTDFLRDKPLSYRVPPYLDWLNRWSDGGSADNMSPIQETHNYRKKQQLRTGLMKKLYA